MTSFTALWVYLARDPLAALTATLIVWLLALRLHVAAGRHPIVNPVLISVAVLAGALYATGTDYASYFQGAQFIHFLLGPATVALAIPMHRNWSQVRDALPVVVTSVVIGGLFAAAIGVGFALAVGTDPAVVASLAPRSVTTPVAMGITERIGGLPSLTATVVILSGMVGSVLGSQILNFVRVRDWRARGLAMGTAAHGLGTARAFMVNPVAGSFSALAMGLNALASAVLIPLLWWLFGL